MIQEALQPPFRARSLSFSSDFAVWSFRRMLKRGSNGFHFRRMFTCLKKSQLLLYSTSVVSSKDAISNPLLVEFLVKSVGFSERQAISIATKIKVSKSLKKSELVVDFLKESGFDGTQIRKVIAVHPSVLRSGVEETLKPKTRAFEDLGFSGSNLGVIISRHPRVLGVSLESKIFPTFGILKSVFGSNEDLVRSTLLMKTHHLFSSKGCRNLSAKVSLMRSYGLECERIKWLMLRGFACMSARSAEKILKQVEEKLGILRTSNMFMYGIHTLTMRSEEKLKSWFAVFRSYGWSETDISTLLRTNPLVLGLSEENVRVKLEYFMEDLGFGSDYLAANPGLLAYSMEKRIVPRLLVRQTLMDRKLLTCQTGVYAFLSMAEPKFMKRFVLPYKEELPQLYENYTQAIGETLFKESGSLKLVCSRSVYLMLMNENPLMVEFLVKSIGFSEEEAVSVVKNLRNPSKCTENSQLVIDFLKESGFDGTQIRKVIARHPKVLHSNVDKTLKPKFRAFEDVGFSGPDLGLLISQIPDILGRNVESSIVPVLVMLKSLFGSNEQLIGVMPKLQSPRWFYAEVCKNLPYNMRLLQSYGLSSERIKWLMLQSRFLFSNARCAGKIVKGVEEKLGIPRTSDAFVFGIYALTRKTVEKMESWLELFRSYGWSETEISTLLRKHPFSVALTENHLRAKLKYFMEDLGLGSDYLATHPALLTYSMEKRIVPRAAVRQTLMDERLLERPLSLYTCLSIPESKFMLEYVLPYQENLPQLFENYTRATGYSPSKKT